MVGLGEDVVVHVDYAEHRLVRTDLGDNVIIHVDYPERCLVINNLGDDVKVHVNDADEYISFFAEPNLRGLS